MKYAIAMFAFEFGAMMMAVPATAAGIGFTVGAPIEERMGSEYGAEYYYRDSKAAQPQPHDRTIRVKTRSGDHQQRRRR